MMAARDNQILYKIYETSLRQPKSFNDLVVRYSTSLPARSERVIACCDAEGDLVSLDGLSESAIRCIAGSSNPIRLYSVAPCSPLDFKAYKPTIHEIVKLVNEEMRARGSAAPASVATAETPASAERVTATPAAPAIAEKAAATSAASAEQSAQENPQPPRPRPAVAFESFGRCPVGRRGAWGPPFLRQQRAGLLRPVRFYHDRPVAQDMLDSLADLVPTIIGPPPFVDWARPFIRRLPGGQVDVNVDTLRPAMQKQAISLLEKADQATGDMARTFAAEAHQLLSILLQLAPESTIDAYNNACALALMGAEHVSSALACLQQAVVSGYDDVQHLMEDPDLASLRESAAEQFNAIVDAILQRRSGSHAAPQRAEPWVPPQEPVTSSAVDSSVASSAADAEAEDAAVAAEISALEIADGVTPVYEAEEAAANTSPSPSEDDLVVVEEDGSPSLDEPVQQPVQPAQPPTQPPVTATGREEDVVIPSHVLPLIQLFPFVPPSVVLYVLAQCNDNMDEAAASILQQYAGFARQGV